MVILKNIIFLLLLVFASVFAEQDGWDKDLEELENVKEDEDFPVDSDEAWKELLADDLKVTAQEADSEDIWNELLDEQSMMEEEVPDFSADSEDASGKLEDEPNVMDDEADREDIWNELLDEQSMMEEEDFSAYSEDASGKLEDEPNVMDDEADREDIWNELLDEQSMMEEEDFSANSEDASGKLEDEPNVMDDEAWNDYSPEWCSMAGTRFLASDVPTPQDCVNICIEKNPSCKAVEWWENGPNDCYDCINPALRIEYNDDTDDSYPPHVLVRPIKAAAPNNCQPNPCQNGASCSINDSPQGYECTCSPGYSGVNCENDINECSKKNGGCSHKCTNTEGSYTCSCPDPELNLAPDRHTCVASGVLVECRQNDMSITLPKALLLGLNREHVTLRDFNCVATETNTYYTLTTTLTGCGTTATHRKGAVVYSNTVLEIPVADDAIITRVREIEIPFSCYYKNSGDATAVGVRPDTRKLIFDQDGKGNFTVALDMFPDDKFASAYNQSDYPVEVKLRQYLYFQASVKSKDKTLSALAENCYATPAQDRNHATKYYILKDGCPVDETTVILKSLKVRVSRFMTEGFKFIADHSFVFVHCHIRICDARNPNSRCAQGCVKELVRKRRDVSSEDKLYPLAQGPLTISSDTVERKPHAKDMTLIAVSTMAVLSALCIMGMIYFSRKTSVKAKAYTILSETPEE